MERSHFGFLVSGVTWLHNTKIGLVVGWFGMRKSLDPRMLVKLLQKSRCELMKAETRMKLVRKARGQTFKTTNHKLRQTKFTLRFLTFQFAKYFFHLPSKVKKFPFESWYSCLKTPPKSETLLAGFSKRDGSSLCDNSSLFQFLIWFLGFVCLLSLGSSLQGYGPRRKLGK